MTTATVAPTPTSALRRPTRTTTWTSPVTQGRNITVTNGNYPANVLIHSWRSPRLVSAKPGWFRRPATSAPSDHGREWAPADDTLWSQLQREVPLAAAGVFNDTVQYTIHCFQRSQHTIEIQVDAVPLPPVEEEDVEDLPNVEKNFPTITAYDNADLKKSSITFVAPVPTSADAGVPFALTVRQKVHNNGPTTGVTGSDTLALTMPDDCTAIDSDDTQPVGPLAVSTLTTLTDVTFTITCDETSNHTFELDDTLTLTGPLTGPDLHIKDPDLNNNTKHAEIDVPVFGTADVDVTSTVTVGLPATVDVSTDYPITYTGTVTNDPTSDGPISGTLSVSASITPGGDCTVVPNNDSAPVVDLAPGASQDLDVAAVVHCTNPSDHTLTVDADFVATPDVHLDITVTDGPDATDAFVSLAYADLKISSAVGAGQDDLPTAGTQVLVGPLTPLGSVVIDIDETVHNNGPYGPVTTTVTRTAAGEDVDGGGDDCSATVYRRPRRWSAWRSASPRTSTRTSPATGWTSRSLRTPATSP